MIVYCSNCGKQFKADACMLSVSENTFCSDNCFATFQKNLKKVILEKYPISVGDIWHWKHDPSSRFVIENFNYPVVWKTGGPSMMNIHNLLKLCEKEEAAICKN